MSVLSIESETSSVIITLLRRSWPVASTDGRAIATIPAATASSTTAKAAPRIHRVRAGGRALITDGSAQRAAARPLVRVHST